MAKSQKAPAPAPPAEYTVVARRYRPQQFADLIGQEHVSTSLVNALKSGRVAHAYLFTGARGVGKTSAARILAKALNCEKGPTPTPCDKCESCLGIAEGQDVDVQEIDGASNNKVEEVRDLRKNVGFMPTRSKYKIYIIDEVHMLSPGAFNALLKTLEEPPPHVKFIFATTEVQKLPITILSRCQRFDFANVGPAKIFDQLKSIVAREGHEADDDALRLIARRAAGSMRDSQSLLDQLLASSGGRLTTEQIHAVLGTAGEERVTELAALIVARDAKAALNAIAAWTERGLQIGELLEQLIEYWRGLMLVNCSGADVPDLPVSPNQREVLCRQASSLSLDTILAGLDVWASAKFRMRGTNQSQVLLEMAVVRLCRLEELLSVGQLVQSLGQGGGSLPQSGQKLAANGSTGASRPQTLSGRPPEASEGVKKNGVMPPESASNSNPASPIPLNPSTLQEIWGRLLRQITDKSPLLAKQLTFANLPAIFGPNSLAIPFHSGYSQAYSACASEANLGRIQEVLRRITGQTIAVKAELVGGPPPTQQAKPADSQSSRPTDRRKQLMELPLFRKAGEVLGAQLWHLDEGFNPTVARPTTPAAAIAEDDETPPAEPDPDEG